MAAVSEARFDEDTRRLTVMKYDGMAIYATRELGSEWFFTLNPLPCDPSSLPKYPPDKELNAKMRDEEAG
ncbi:hypothetical protein Dimus_033144, partial [Dionaea muscipula]